MNFRNLNFQFLSCFSVLSFFLNRLPIYFDLNPSLNFSGTDGLPPVPGVLRYESSTLFTVASVPVLNS